MEYIYHMFGRHKFGKITTNLDVLITRFNQVEQGTFITAQWQLPRAVVTVLFPFYSLFQIQYWVVTEIVRELDMVKRVALIKKFIKIAG